MRRILVGKHHFALVDDEDYEILKGFKWRYSKKGYATTGLFAVMRNRKLFRKSIMMHRIVAILAKWPLDNMQVDHIKDKRLDNRKSQLRLATHGQNKANGKKYQRAKGNSSEYKGVTWVKRDERWTARIVTEGKCIHLGYYRNEIEAAQTYDEAALKYHGEFARLNFPR